MYWPAELPLNSPDHTQLPESDGSFVKNFQEHPQSLILTDWIGATLKRLHPDGQYAIGQDCGIYWRKTAHWRGSADWFYVPNAVQAEREPALVRLVARIYCADYRTRVCLW